MHLLKRVLGMGFILCGILLGVFGCGSMSSSRASDTRTIEFRLGDHTFVERDTVVSFPLDGVMSIPEGDNNPVVFILHGAHEIKDVAEDRYYNGFSYLSDYLAQQGYATVVLNLNRAYSFEPIEGDETFRASEIFDAYFSLLQRANEGEKLFDIELTDKLNLTKLNFIGHSRGGDNSLSITKMLEEEEHGRVQSVLAIASPLIMGYQQYYLDIPLGVILPQYDGDVAGLDSNALVDYAYSLGDKRETPAASAFLYGGNHNHFNTALSSDTLSPPENAKLIPAEKQQEFLCKYATDFLNASNRDALDWVQLLGNDAPLRYGIDFMPSVIMPGGVRLLAPSEAENDIFPEMMELDLVRSSLDFTQNTAAPLKLPGGLKEGIAIYRASWKQPNSSLLIRCEQTDWSKFKYLSLFIANDSAFVQQMDHRIPLEIQVRLTDKAGKDVVFPLTETNSSALRFNPTKVENMFEDMEGLPAYWDATEFTPLSTQIFPLSPAQGIDLEQIERLELRGLSQSGALVLRGIDLY